MAYRIRRAPDSSRQKPTYYAIAGGKLYWTQMRDVAQPFDSELLAESVLRRLIKTNAKLHTKVSIEPHSVLPLRPLPPIDESVAWSQPRE